MDVVDRRGCITPMEPEVQTVWEGLKRGLGRGSTTIFDASRFPTKSEVQQGRERGRKIRGLEARGRHTAAAAPPRKPCDSGIWMLVWIRPAWVYRSGEEQPLRR
jgi:hypothetical protein